MTNPRNRNLLIIIAVLVLTNIAVLAYFLGQKKPGKQEQPAGRDRNGMATMLQKEVGFNDQQLSEYKIMKDQQRETIRPMFDDMRKTKDSLFRLLSYQGNDADTIVNRLTDAIANKQKELDLQTFRYFKKLRNLCTAEQQPKYDSLILRTFRRMGKKSNEPDKK